jgi:hypothetical protein
MRYAVTDFWITFPNGAGPGNKNVFPIPQRYFADQYIMPLGAE